jgi:uncharacterized protein (DUF58 family)
VAERRVSDAGVAPPAGRQGPGPIAGELVAALDLAMARRASGAMPGEHRGSGIGSGTELYQLRPYVPGDDVRKLDAAATARTREPHVRVHVPERVLTTWIVVDVSPSMAFGTADRLKSDVAEGVVEVIGRLALRRAGRVGLLAFGGERPRLIPPRGGRRALVALRRAISEGVAPDGPPGEDLAAALDRIARLATRPGLVAIVSDFDAPADWSGRLSALGARHSLLAVEVRDPREDELPAVGRLALVDPESGRQVTVDTASRDLRRRYSEAMKERRAEVAAALRRAGARQVTVSTEGQWLEDLGRVLV